MHSASEATISCLELRWITLQERVLNSLDRLAERLHPGRLAPHLLTGLRGERAALFALRRRGYTVVAARWSSPKAPGDIDLVAWQSDPEPALHPAQLCFIEVKTRTARDLTPAESAVDDTKRRTLRTLARLYVATFPEAERRSIRLRFDVVSVYQLGRRTEVEIFPAAFSLQPSGR
jgi:putative endonuclease